MKLIVLEDGPASNAPHIRHLMSNDLRFILGAKEQKLEGVCSLSQQKKREIILVFSPHMW